MSTPLLNPISGGLYAPVWSGIQKQLPGFCDVEFDQIMGQIGIPISVTVAAGAISLKNQVQIDSDADYLTREIFVAPIAGSTLGGSGAINPQDLKIRITDGDGNAITSDWITANDLNQCVGPCALPFRKGTIVLIDLWNQGDGNLIVQAGFKGIKRFPCNETQAPIPRFVTQRSLMCKQWPGVRFEDFEYFWEFSNGTDTVFPPWVNNLQPLAPNTVWTRFSLPTESDADFLWRGTCGMIMQTGGPVAAPQQFFITFYDPNQIPMANTFPRPGQIPAAPGPGCELVLSNGGGRMQPQFPELFIPRSGVLQADLALTIPADTTVQFSLRGVKMYNEGDCKW